MAYFVYVFDDCITVHIVDDKDYTTSLVFDSWEYLFSVMTWSRYVPTIYVRMGVKS